MRTTVNIDDNLYEIVRSTAHQNRKGIGATMEILIERGLRQEAQNTSGTVSEVDELTGFPVFSSERLVTAADVHSLEDDA